MVVLTARQRRAARFGAGLLFVSLVVLVPTNLGVALKVAGLIGGFGTIITVFVERPGEPAKTVDELRASLRAQIREEWLSEADQRGLLTIPLLPVTLEFSAGPGGHGGGSSTRSNLLPGDDVAWEPAHYRAFAAGLVRDGLVRRAVVTGTAGGGKSTFGLLLTLGLLDVDRAPGGGHPAADGAGEPGWIPLLLSASSWDTNEDFAVWFDRQLRTTYPSTAALRPARDGTPGLSDLPASGVFTLVRPTVEQVRGYLGVIAGRRQGRPADWQPVLRELHDVTTGAPLRLISYLDLLHRHEILRHGGGSCWLHGVRWCSLTSLVAYDVGVNLKGWAEAAGVGCTTARRWYCHGTLPVPARKVGGLILVGDPERQPTSGVAVVYARVSSVDQEPDLDRQVARVTTWAGENGIAVGRVVTEILTSLCARLDGRRAAANRAARGVAVIVEGRL